MVITYLKMKKNEYKIKNAIYSSIITVIENQKEISSLAKKLFEAFKDSSVDDLRAEFIGKLAEIIHDENKVKNETDKESK